MECFAHDHTVYRRAAGAGLFDYWNGDKWVEATGNLLPSPAVAHAMQPISEADTYRLRDIAIEYFTYRREATVSRRRPRYGEDGWNRQECSNTASSSRAPAG